MKGGRLKRHHVGPAKTRVNEHGVVERVPQDSWNPDGWIEVTEGMRRHARELGLMRVSDAREESDDEERHAASDRPA
jgi:hypothetical protein